MRVVQHVAASLFFWCSLSVVLSACEAETDPLGVVPNSVEFGWRLIGNYAAFSFTSTTSGVSFAS